MRRTQEGFVPFKDDKTKDAENTDFEAGSNNTPMASHRGLERSTVFAANSTQYYVKMLDNTQSIICAFSLSCYEFIAKTSSNYPSVKNCGFLVRKVQLG